MKFRKGFVTNSSSSSFLIAKKNLTENQILAIRYHSELGDKLGLEDAISDYWDIDENKDFISGKTSMDNFSMSDFLKKIGINPNVINWSEYSFNIETAISENKEDIEKNKMEEWEYLLESIKNKYI